MLSTSSELHPIFDSTINILYNVQPVRGGFAVPAQRKVLGVVRDIVVVVVVIFFHHLDNFFVFLFTFTATANLFALDVFFYQCSLFQRKPLNVNLFVLIYCRLVVTFAMRQRKGGGNCATVVTIQAFMKSLAMQP